MTNFEFREEETAAVLSLMVTNKKNSVAPFLHLSTACLFLKTLRGSPIEARTLKESFLNDSY